VPRALGQCGGYVLEPGPGTIASTNGVSALTVWDPDGSGPAPAAPVVGFGTSVQRWDGNAWQPLGSIPTGVAGLTVFGGDLLAGTSVFISQDDYWSVARWDGAAWVRYGAGPTTMNWSRDFVVHQGELYASTTDAAFFRFDGVTWHNLGPGFGEFAAAIASYGGQLIGGGWMSLSLQPYPSFGAIGWTGAGQAWEPVGDGGVTDVYGLCIHGGKLVAVGTSGVGIWDGAAWQRLGDMHQVSSAISYLGQLIVGGGFAGGVKRWDGVSWQDLGSGLARSNGYSPSVNRMAEWNGDLLMVGGFDIAGGLPAGNIARYRCIPCYANCDSSLTPPVLTANDFQCFLSKFAAGESYANCDGSTSVPVLNANDFQCFLNVFAAGCS
jgi:hypothetical protein